ncbi:MGDG synthase family glycosyltransferase [Clostridium paraputrificum]|uniref:MGDG synthase family glycosyltransferase n=1 Tax=Clostridium paraputrificum TaxID=29363 RepID=UPI0006BF3B0C|nr:glycosyltransferase [Clostridium paraputrificum]CUN50484.1 monogalactosyldiacylglycerol synthase [Clostridium paraputrificum]
MKKILILTTSTGQGHNQAANSLLETFESEGFTCIKHDFLEGNNKFLNDIIVQGYEISASKFPKIYGWAYKLTDHKFIYKFLPLVFRGTDKKLSKLIQDKKPDIIIGTHPFTVNIISRLKKKGMKIPFISVVTDFKAHYTYIHPSVDAYITGSKFTKNSLIEQGIDSSKIFPYGIPIRESFFERNETIPEIKDDEYFNLLLMSGSMGLKNISYVLDELLNNKHKLRITVVCGKNKKLKYSLLKKSQNTFIDKKLHILGFSNDIASFMEYSDLIISKPGGLTVSEAIVKNLPLIIPFAIPGQEMENTEFLTSNGYAYYINNVKEINNLIDMLIDNPKYLIDAKKNLKELASTYTIKAIVDLANNLIEKKITGN